MKKLSVITVARDDNYGDEKNNGIYKLQNNLKKFISRFKFSLENNIFYLEKLFKNNFEYIVVDWSPLNNKLLIYNKDLTNILSNRNIKYLVAEPKKIELCGLNPLGFYEYIGKNYGIRNSQGDYILITNSDDYFNNEMVLEIYDAVNKDDQTKYYRPYSRIDVDLNQNFVEEGLTFNNNSIFGQIGTAAAGDFILSHRKNIIDIGEGFNENVQIFQSEKFRQTALDGALLTNMYIRGIRPVCFNSSIYSFQHNKIERYKFFEKFKTYKNKKDWGMLNPNKVSFYYLKLYRFFSKLF
jgi:hypothetical protein